MVRSPGGILRQHTLHKAQTANAHDEVATSIFVGSPEARCRIELAYRLSNDCGSVGQKGRRGLQRAIRVLS